MARFEKGKGKKKTAWTVDQYGVVLRSHEAPDSDSYLPGYRRFRSEAEAHAEAQRLAAEWLGKGFQPADAAAQALVSDLPVSATEQLPPSLPLRQDIYIYNEATGFCITSAKMAGKGIESGEPEWDKAVKSGKLIPISLIQDDPLLLRVVVGDALSEQEQQEWVGRVDWQLDLSDGQLVVCGGAEYLMDGYEDGDEYANQFVRQLAVPPGHYRASVYYYLCGVNGSSCLDELAGGYGRMEAPGQWFRQSHPGLEFPDWLRHWCSAYPDADPGHEQDWQSLPYPDSETEYVGFLLHLQPDPAAAETKKQLGKPATEEGWFGETANARKPALCPLGLVAQDVIGHQAPPPPGTWVYLYDVAARSAATALQALEEPLPVPSQRLVDLFLLAWFANAYARPELRLRLPEGHDGAASVEAFAWPAETVAWFEDGCWHIGFGNDLYVQELFDAVAAVSPFLAAQPPGSVLELLCAPVHGCYGEDPDAGLQRYQGALADGQWLLTASYPALDRATLGAALQLVEDCQDGTHLKVHDQDEGRAILAWLAAKYGADAFEDNPPTLAGQAIRLNKADTHLLRLVAAAAFAVRYRQLWPVATPDAASEW